MTKTRAILAGVACAVLTTAAPGWAGEDDGWTEVPRAGSSGSHAPIETRPPGSDAPWPDPRCDDEACYEHGECSYLGDSCVAGGSFDCRQSSGCRDDGQCFYDAEDGSCEEDTMRRNKAAMVVGIVGMGVGAVSVAVGVVGLTFLRDVCHADSSCNEQSATSTYTAMAVLGGMVTAGGLLAVLVGAPKVPRTAEASYLPSVGVGVSSISLDWTF